MISGCAFVTGCGSFCVAPEKKLAILSLSEGLGGGAAGEGGAGEAVAGETVAGEVVAGGADDAVVAGPPNPPPLQPGISKAHASNAAAGV